MRCHWITRDYTCKPTAGDLLYSYYVATTLAAAGAEVTVVCRARDDQAPVPPEPGVERGIVDAPLRAAGAALVSGLLSVASRNGVHVTRRAVELELERDWFFILVDTVGGGWVLPLLESHR